MPRGSDVETSVERVDPLVGTIFDQRFRVDERIAVGGFGAIYRATHVKSGHRVALKVLLPSLARDLGVVARFRREGDTLTALRCPHTINAYELGQAADHTLFIVMELLYGESLFERYQANGPFEWKRMVRIARQVCESLEEAHGKGIVHRDLKPTNIHLERHDDDIDYVKVLDFGIAKIIGGNQFEAADLTNAGQMIGTLDYMSPEQMVGAKVTGQTDIYTLGIVMYEMIAGCTPFPEAMTAAQALAAVMKTMPDPLYLRAPVPEELDRIVMRCLERDTAKRYQTVAELRADLDRLLAGHAPDRSHVIETKPIARLDEVTQFTPPPERLLNELRRTGDFEHTQFTPPPQQLIDQSRAPEWDDEDEHASTTAKKPNLASAAWNDEHERATKVARLADIAAAQAQSRGTEHDQVTKVARVQDLAAAAEAHASDDMERATNVARGARAAAMLNEGEGDGAERDATSPRRRHGSPEADTSTQPVRRHESSPSRKQTAPPPLPVPPRTLTPQAPVPPRTLTPQAPVPPRTLTPQNVAPPPRPLPRTSDTPIPQLVAAPFSAAPKAPTSGAIPPAAIPTPPGVSPYASTAPAMQPYVPGQPHPLGASPPHGEGATLLGLPPAPRNSPPFGAPFARAPGMFDMPQYPQAPPAKNFDMGRMAAREAMIRRVIWILVLVVATAGGIVLATQL